MAAPRGGAALLRHRVSLGSPLVCRAAVDALTRLTVPRLCVARPPAAAAAAAAAVVGPAGGAPSRGLFGQSFEVGEIEAVPRDKSGSRHAQWARQNKLIPGIVYGPELSGKRATEQLIYVRESDLRREVNKRGATFTNTLFDM